MIGIKGTQKPPETCGKCMFFAQSMYLFGHCKITGEYMPNPYTKGGKCPLIEIQDNVSDIKSTEES